MESFNCLNVVSYYTLKIFGLTVEIEQTNLKGAAYIYKIVSPPTLERQAENWKL